MVCFVVLQVVSVFIMVLGVSGERRVLDRVDEYADSVHSLNGSLIERQNAVIERQDAILDHLQSVLELLSKQK